MNTFELGREAFETGVKLDTNPYAHEPIEWLQWQRGWLAESWEAQGAAGFNERGLAAINPFDHYTELQAYLCWNAGWRAAQALWYEQMDSEPVVQIQGAYHENENRH